MSDDLLPDEPEFFQGDRTKPMFLDAEGQPIGLRTFAERFDDYEGRLIAQDFVGNREVRTMWLGVVGGDFLMGLSSNSEIFGSIICTQDMLPDNGAGMVLQEAVAAMRGSFGKEILTGTREDALEAHAMLLAELRAQQ